VAITGAARGIGRATASALVDAGARVAIGDLDGELAGSVAAELGANTIGLDVDVSDAAAFSRFLDTTEQQLGPLDVLINNAGIMPTGPADAEEVRATERVVAINLTAVIHGTKHAMRRMKPRRRGHIINICSATARVPGAGVASYSATKAGVLGFSEAVALELDGTGVAISVVLPSLTSTELVSGINVRRGTPVCRPEDVAEAVLRLLKRPRFQVAVPRSVGPVLFVNQSLPARVRHALARATKTDSLIADMDVKAHATYDERLRAAIASGDDHV
jgi:short-subunit dehydrogenase